MGVAITTAKFELANEAVLFPKVASSFRRALSLIRMKHHGCLFLALPASLPASRILVSVESSTGLSRNCRVSCLDVMQVNASMSFVFFRLSFNSAYGSRGLERVGFLFEVNRKIIECVPCFNVFT